MLEYFAGFTWQDQARRVLPRGTRREAGENLGAESHDSGLSAPQVGGVEGCFLITDDEPTTSL